MLKKIGLGLLAVTLLGGCVSSNTVTPVDYNTDGTRAMPKQTYWWEVN